MNTLALVGRVACLALATAGGLNAFPALSSPTAGRVPSRLPVRDSSHAQEPPSDSALRKAWRKLPEEERAELAEWLTAEISGLDILQNRHQRRVFGSLDRDPYDWPDASTQPRLFDPEVHAPAQPIPRKITRKEDKRWLERVFRLAPQRKLESAWRYDYGTRSVQRVQKVGAEHVFECALAGFVPDYDLAEALVERSLDLGELQVAHEAFSHAYSDREGRVSPSVSLYDAWGSGLEIEMPDVECLGLLHTIEDDWSSFVAPVPGSRQDALYARLEKHFVAIKAHRDLRYCLAVTLLSAEPGVPLNYLPHRDRLHAIWATAEADPAKIVESLPVTPEALSDWIEVRGKEVDNDRAAWAAGQARKRGLERGAEAIRAALVRVMREAGAL